MLEFILKFITEKFFKNLVNRKEFTTTDGGRSILSVMITEANQ